MKRFELFAFVTNHCDNCPWCVRGSFCETGRELIERAIEIGVEIFLPGPLAETPKAKA